MNLILLRKSIRRLLKNKFTSFVSVFGLSVGFVAFILIALFKRYELSWDKNNENFDRIYMVQRNLSLSSRNTGGGNISLITPAITTSLISGFSGVESTAAAAETNGRFLSVAPAEQLRIEIGLVSLSVARRTREIGIRKITGSSVNGIFLLLNREFFVLLVISLALAWPACFHVVWTPGNEYLYC